MHAQVFFRPASFFPFAPVALAFAVFVAFPADLAARPIRLGPTVAGFSSRLPVLVIDNAGGGPLTKDGPDHAGELNVFKPEDNITRIAGRLPMVSTSLTLSVRGTSSADFPKKSYNLTLRDDRGAKYPQPLLDLPASEKWALVAPWAFDPSYINNAFVYALSNRIGRWAPRTCFVEVFFNTRGGEVGATDYAGIYVLTQRIEPGEERVDVARLSSAETTKPAVTGGYILKIDSPSADDVAWNTSHGVSAGGESAVILVAPRAQDSTVAQRDYLRDYVQQMENTLHADHAGGWTQRASLDYIDRSSWVDHHLLNTFACNPDALVRSAYFTKDRGGKLVAGPVWDFDRALGSYLDERSFRWDVWTGTGGVDVWRSGWWGIIAQDPEFMQEWIDRWQVLRGAELSTPSLVLLAKILASFIGPEAAARDAARWPDNASPYLSHAAQIDRLTEWLTQRAWWIDGQFVAAATARRHDGTLTFAAPAEAQLAYTLDGSDPRSLGGEIAPNARLTSKPLTVAANANVHVRSYRAALRGVFPGSPWSSVVGGEQSSPLTPSARLINLSSRGLMGAGEHALIAGVVVADTTAKRYLSRAIGPGLAAFGTHGFASDPQLSIILTNGSELSRNAGWQNSPGAADLQLLAGSVGAFPLAAGSLDSALASEVGAGAFTLQASTPSGATGVGLLELYELEANGRTANLSTRAMIRRGGDPLIGGFVVQGPAFKRLLIRAIGPTLATLGLANVLSDPVLTINAGSNLVASNDRWAAAGDATVIATAMARVGAFPLDADSEDAALLITLPPGAYTMEVKGKADGEGLALLEIYDVP